MKRVFLNFVLFFVAAFFVGCCGQSGSDVDLNLGWSFRLGEIDSPYSGSKIESEEGWQSVTIPHDWSIESGYTQENTAGSNGFLPGGVGWYRNTFKIPADWRNKSVVVRFEGVYNNSQVWINGNELGFFPSGYLDFEYDLTPYLNKNGKNTIAVRVDRRAYADARWYVGAGIYRPVHLIARDEVYIPTHGQMITTPEVAKEQAQVKVLSDIVNSGDEARELQVEYRVLSGESVVAEASSQVVVAAGESIQAEQLIDVKSPKLWSTTDPNLYTLQSVVKCGDEVMAEANERFGIRTIEFNTERGFLLNGEMVKIKGANIHHDLGCVGVALYDDVLYRRLKSLQDMGVNAIRTAHNPHSESMMAMCDEMGLLVMDEFTDEWHVLKDKWIVQRSMANIPDELESGYPTYFKDFAERDLKHFLRRDYNHPCVIMWSIGNEIEWTYKYYFASNLDKMGYQGLVYTGKPELNVELVKKRFAEKSGGKDELAETAVKLAKWVKDVDTTRPVTSGVVIPSVSRISGYTDALDIVGYNYKESYYDIDHERYPEQVIFGSENVGQYFEWSAVADKDYVPGIFVWTGVDYLGENGPWPHKGGDYSFFDFACFKTPRGHFFEALWNDAPKTHIVTTPAAMSEFKLQSNGTFKVELRKDPLRRWLWFETFDKWSYEANEQIVVQVYSNAPQVELLLNGKSLGVKQRADFAQENVLLWQIPYSAGELVAVGQDGSGKELSRYALRTAEAASQLVVACDDNDLASNGADLAHIEVELRDANGTVVTDKPQTVTVELPSDLVIVGVDNGSDVFVGSHKSNSIVTDNGHALFIVRSKRGTAGSANVKFTTDGGLNAECVIEYK